MKNEIKAASVQEITKQIVAYSKYDIGVQSLVDKANKAVEGWKVAKEAMKNLVQDFVKTGGDIKALNKSLLASGINKDVLLRIRIDLGLEINAKAAPTTQRAKNAEKVLTFATEFVSHAVKEAKNKEVALAALRKAADLLRAEIAKGNK